MSATEFTKECLQSEDCRELIASQIKLAAIRARVDGDYDNPALMHFGPLGDTRDDIRRIIMSEVTPDTAMVLNALRTKFTQEGK